VGSDLIATRKRIVAAQAHDTDKQEDVEQRIALLGKRFYGKKGSEWVDPTDIDVEEGVGAIGFG
jgi:hypothetical protein